LSSNKSKTKNEPASFALPAITAGIQQTRDVFDQNQPRLDAMSRTANDAFGQIAPGAFGSNPFVQQAQNAASQTLGGAYLGADPGAATYARLQTQQNPAAGLLSGMAGQNNNPAFGALGQMAGSNYNPAYQTMAGLAQGSTSPGQYGGFGTTNPAYSSLQGLAGGSTSPGDYSGIGAANPAANMFQGLAGGGSNSALPGLKSAAYGAGTIGAGDNVIGRIANGTNGDNPAAGYDAAIMSGKYLNANPGHQMYADTLAGKYLDNNPYVDAIAKQGEDAALKAANSRFAASGLGAGLSTAYTDVATRNVADAGNTIRFQNYENERGRQLQAGSQADAAFANERGNMEGASGRTSSNYNAAQDRSLTAAQALSAGSRADSASRLNALGMLSDADQQTFANQANVATNLGSLFNQQQGLQLQGQQARDQAFQSDREAQLSGAQSLGSLYNQGQGLQLQSQQARDQAFQADRGAQLQAAQGLGSLYNQGADRQLSAAQGLGSLYGQGQDRQLQAAQGLGSLYNQTSQTQLAAAQAASGGYDAERARMMQAMGLVPGLREAEYAGINPALNLLNSAATIPYSGVAAYNAGINGLSNGYGTTTQKTSQSLGSVAAGLAGTIGAGWASGGFAALPKF
jgi:hypothetical protein